MRRYQIPDWNRFAGRGLEVRGCIALRRGSAERKLLKFKSDDTHTQTPGASNLADKK